MSLPKHAAVTPNNRPSLSLVSSKRITALQIGIGWFPETPGGLDCVYYNLAQHLPDRGVDIIGLVAGSDNVIFATAKEASPVSPGMRMIGNQGCARSGGTPRKS